MTFYNLNVWKKIIHYVILLRVKTMGKVVRPMKLVSFIMLLITCLHITGDVFGQQDRRISVKADSLPLPRLLRLIEKKTGYRQVIVVPAELIHLLLNVVREADKDAQGDNGPDAQVSYDTIEALNALDDYTGEDATCLVH